MNKSVRKAPKGDITVRIIRAMWMTNQVIGLDMGWNEKEPPAKVVREVVADSTHLEQYGCDPEAVAAFRAMSKPERDAMLNKAFI